MGKTLYDWNAELDPKLLDEEDEDVRWYADVWSTQIYFRKLTVVRRTPKGMWLSGMEMMKEVWRSNDSKKASLTRREALYRLWRRKQSYVRHEERRMKDAYEREQVVRNALTSLGVETHPREPKFKRVYGMFDME